MRVQSIPARRPQGGFTLIELVMVMVIIAILAAVAIPKFVDMSGDAAQAAVKGMAGSMSSASSINYAARKANSANGSAVANCTDVAALLSPALVYGASPIEYNITAAAVLPNATQPCTLTHNSSGKTATYTAIGI